MDMEQETRAVRSTSLGWMIQRMARRLNKAMDDRLSALDLSLQHFAVMMTVLETDGLSQSEIGDRFEMPPYAVSRAIDHLEGRGLLARRPHPGSRRTHTVHATDQGRALSGHLFTIVRDVNRAFAEPLTAGEQAEFRRLLAKLM